jgi:hypothetical protein
MRCQSFPLICLASASAAIQQSSASESMRIAISACWLVLVNAAQAGPPFVTDDPEPPAAGGWEINVPFILERTPGKTEMNAPLFDLNYGLPNVQLKLEIPVEIIHEDHADTAVGPGDLLPGVKWRFFEDQKSQVQLGVYPQALLPTGDHRRGLGDGRPAYVLPLLAQKSWAKWTLYGNVGYWWQNATGKRDYWYGGAVLDREINERLSLGVELFGNTTKERGNRAKVAFNAGGAWKLSKRVNLLFAIGRDIAGDTRAMVYVGLQVLTK